MGTNLNFGGVPFASTDYVRAIVLPIIIIQNQIFQFAYMFFSSWLP
jgi:hypothetical protein